MSGDRENSNPSNGIPYRPNGKKPSEGWIKRGHWAPPYFMPPQIWPRIVNFLAAKSF